MDITKIPLALRVEMLEQLLQGVARAVLLQEYSKDLDREGLQPMCEKLGTEGDLYGALRELARFDGGAESLLERIRALP